MRRPDPSATGAGKVQSARAGPCAAAPRLCACVRCVCVRGADDRRDRAARACMQRAGFGPGPRSRPSSPPARRRDRRDRAGGRRRLRARRTRAGGRWRLRARRTRCPRRRWRPCSAASPPTPPTCRRTPRSPRPSSAARWAGLGGCGGNRLKGRRGLFTLFPGHCMLCSPVVPARTLLGRETPRTWAEGGRAGLHGGRGR